MYKQKKEIYIRYLYTQLPQEPKEGKMTKLSFRLADGDRVVRLFSENDNLEVGKDDDLQLVLTPFFIYRRFIDL